MARKNDFNANTKAALAQRVANHCSFPGCDAVTIGPSDEAPDASSSSGMACHIVAAADGKSARRKDPKMSEEERSSIENGIWMCFRHGKIIDTDETRFSVQMLKTWKKFAEDRAQWEHEYGRNRKYPLTRIGLAEENLKFENLGEENERIGIAFHDCCVELMWGETLGRAVRDISIELVRNALTHGQATFCEIQIRQHAIFIRDNGKEYSCLDLSNSKNGQGGNASMQHILTEHHSKIVVGAKYEKGVNEAMFALSRGIGGIALAEPCTVFLKREDRDLVDRGELPDVLLSPTVAPCRILYVVLPSYLTASDVYKLRVGVKPELITGKQIVLVAWGASQLVLDKLGNLFPGAWVLNTE